MGTHTALAIHLDSFPHYTVPTQNIFRQLLCQALRTYPTNIVFGEIWTDSEPANLTYFFHFRIVSFAFKLNSIALKRKKGSLYSPSQRTDHTTVEIQLGYNLTGHPTLRSAQIGQDRITVCHGLPDTNVVDALPMSHKHDKLPASGK